MPTNGTAPGMHARTPRRHDSQARPKRRKSPKNRDGEIVTLACSNHRLRFRNRARNSSTKPLRCIERLRQHRFL